MTDKDMKPGNPAASQPPDDRSSRTGTIVRWAIWIAIAVAIAWVSADVIIRH